MVVRVVAGVRVIGRTLSCVGVIRRCIGAAGTSSGNTVTKQDSSESSATGSDNDEAAQAHNNMGILLIDAGQPELATKELNQAIALNPREQNSYIGRGMIEYQGGDWKSATADFYSAARLAPSPVACFWLGRALESAGQIAQAKQAYAESLRLMPGLADARARLDALNALGPIK